MKLTLASLSLWVTASTLNCRLRSVSDFLWNVSLILRQQGDEQVFSTYIRCCTNWQLVSEGDHNYQKNNKSSWEGPWILFEVTHISNFFTSNRFSGRHWTIEWRVWKACLKCVLVVGCPICEVIKCLTESLQPDRPKTLPDHDIINLLSYKTNWTCSVKLTHNILHSRLYATNHTYLNICVT